MARALPQISEKFKGAVQKTDQEKKIAQLQAEIEQLRVKQSPELEAELQLLREKLKNSSGEVEIELELIDPNPHQPRQTITLESIQAKARLLKKHGQITPIILVAQEDGRYILLDGQLRTEGAKLLGWKSIRAVVVPMPKDLTQSSLITFLGFEDLNPLDKAEAVIQEVIKATALSSEEITTALATVLKRIERDSNIKELAKLTSLDVDEQKQGLESLGIIGEEQNLFLSLLELGLNPASVKSNLIPMLFLPADLKNAIRQKGLKGAHALALSTLSAKALETSEEKALKERTRITQKVLAENLTVPETRELIKKVKAEYITKTESESKEVKFLIQKINSISEKTLVGASNKQLQELKTLLQQKLLEIENLNQK
ncbi:ParB/RepB/Spo0J family partition protein (plasmid) [Anabaena sp. FACHB-709]|uniref:Chromosome partitioning protein, ParB family n=2 Tax=Nostocaceae TaxID=1162 RepID=A0A1Z4KUM9_ANAVA|nr:MULTISPECIES: ParB/RepB/Spo0J family partition protein [Nostocaceae]BAY72726.1 chromosome partitioning protein, ParB family [Trichormus variabilis NIES-23]MBD2174949.1 ParB/RepB/Spo0J family partition protein [Anabaena cylindrica FACHB-318]MBD2266704.1 ParB/RepB/Spo0J family partition protein [Anabaena sp. FACHB-709]MBD2276350.1 ParB/RepB/Spo0J family partition protein [Nostoc sp. PCC 7120 = FACHB-418]MBD2286922.1 ParB/RepB/Spo0J family partition protein [Anabaena cylindrica FACHB-170]